MLLFSGKTSSIISGIQFISIGLLGELFTYYSKRREDHYIVKKHLD